MQNGKSCLISTTLLVHTTTATISIKNLFVHFRQIFIYIFRPYLFTKPSLQFPLTLPFSIPQQFFTSLFSHTAIPTSYTKSIFPASVLQPIQDVSRNQWARESCEESHCFNLCPLPRSIHKENKAHNHWFLIAHGQKIGVLRVVVSDEDAWD